MSEERRVSPRFGTNFPVTLCVDGNTFPANSINLSERGGVLRDHRIFALFYAG